LYPQLGHAEKRRGIGTNPATLGSKELPAEGGAAGRAEEIREAASQSGRARAVILATTCLTRPAPAVTMCARRNIGTEPTQGEPIMSKPRTLLAAIVVTISLAAPAEGK
jgi:hypothetical protein